MLKKLTEILNIEVWNSITPIFPSDANAFESTFGTIIIRKCEKKSEDFGCLTYCAIDIEPLIYIKYEEISHEKQIELKENLLNQINSRLSEYNPNIIYREAFAFKIKWPDVAPTNT